MMTNINGCVSDEDIVGKTRLKNELRTKKIHEMKIKVNYCDDLKLQAIVDNEYKWLYQQVCMINKNELDLKYDIELVDKLSKYMVDVEAKKVKK